MSVVDNAVFLSQEVLDVEYDRLCNDPYYQDVSPSLLKREVELESLMRAHGLMRELNNNENSVSSGRESNTSYGIALLKRNINVLAQAIDKELDIVRSGRPGCSRSALRYIKDLDSPTIAYISLKVIIDTLSRLDFRATLQNMAYYIGQELENEARCRSLMAVSPKRGKIAVSKINKSSKKRGKDKKYAAFFGIMEKARKGKYSNEAIEDLTWELWPKSDQVIIGTKLLTLIADVTGLIQVKRTKGPDSKWMYDISIGDGVKTWIDDWAWKTGLMAPVCLPTVIPPRPYTDPIDGGYHTSFIRRYPMVKSKDRAYFEVLMAPETIARMSPVYQALKAAMDTPWKVNKPVLQVMSKLWRSGAAVDCLPSQEEPIMPLCPKCGKPIDGPHPCFEDKEVYRTWAYQAKEVYRTIESNKSKALIVHRLVWIAEQYQDDPAIYFPYQLDFRGRIYALPQFLNPQGSDLAKGLLTFATSKPLGTQEAADWLAVHVANCHGEDKLSFQDRIAWTKGHSTEIQAIAQDPMGTLPLWTNADSPFCYLAACLEWDGYLREGLSYSSSLPIALDGTCSGLQHYSAMLRDAVGGACVNLVPQDKPADIYRTVAERTIELLKAVPVESEDYEMAQQWLNSGILDRKITKRAVMTLPYGSTLFSAKEYIVDRMKEAIEKEHKSLPWSRLEGETAMALFNEGLESDSKPIYDPISHAGQWLGNYVWAAIKDVLVAAPQAMDWLKVMAAALVREGMPVSWVAPSGLPVIQRYVETKARRIETTLSGGLVYTAGGERVKVTADQGLHLKLTLQEDTDSLDKNKQRTGIAPNFVHSMDASALVFAVCEAHEHHGIDSFALIHDSFGTHAADTAKLAWSIRSSFVWMYRHHDPLGEFDKRVRTLLPLEATLDLPHPPLRGALDLNTVMESLYFFS